MNKEEIEKAYACESNHPFIEIEKEGFVRGAEWRINSVWHTPDELPNKASVIIMHLDEDVEEYSFGVKELCEGTIRWAYVSDLLPEMKEGAK